MFEKFKGQILYNFSLNGVKLRNIVLIESDYLEGKVAVSELRLVHGSLEPTKTFHFIHGSYYC